MITIILPWPDAALSPNCAKRHWRSKQAAKVKAHQVGMVAARLSPSKTWREFTPDAEFRLHLTFCPPDRRRRDWDNIAASLKNYQDGWCETLGIDDRQLRCGTWEWGEVVKSGQVIVRLEERR